MLNNISTDTLTLFGLSPKEQTIYIANLELGPTLQVDLAQKAKMKRTTLREFLPGLLNRGTLQQKVVGKRKMLVARDPRDLIAEIDDKAKKAHDALPLLLAMQNSLSTKPEVRFFEGVEGVKQVYELTLSTGLTVYSFINSELIHPEIQKWVLEHFQQKKLERQFWAYNIVTASENVDLIMPEHGWRKNKLISKEQYPFEMEIFTFGDYVAFIHFRQTEEPSAILIKSQAAADTFLSIHKLIWNNIK